MAILLVLFAHFDHPLSNPLSGAGHVGVTLFFTLSGFLITALLLEEYDRTGRVALGAFYRRRARRLFPALGVVLLAVAVLQVWRPVGVSVGMFASVVLYVSNYWQLAHPDLGALSQTWSLAIEEQFYAIWPLVFLFGISRGRRWLAVATGVLIVVSVVTVVTSTGQVQWWGSPQRASSLLAGCLLAVWMSSRREGAGSPWWAAGGLVALVPLTVAADVLPATAYILGVPVVGCVVLWATSQRWQATWLQGPVLRWFGSRSYAIYLWHYVVIWTLPGINPDMWAIGALVRVPLALLLAEASWRLVEHPRRRSRHTRLSPQELVGNLTSGR